MNYATLGSIYWDVVVECLVKFHHFDQEKAHRKVTELRKGLLEAPEYLRKDVSNLVYHQEAFYLACDLAENEINLAEYKQEYGQMLARSGLSEGGSNGVD